MQNKLSESTNCNQNKNKSHLVKQLNRRDGMFPAKAIWKYLYIFGCQNLKIIHSIYLRSKIDVYYIISCCGFKVCSVYISFFMLFQYLFDVHEDY